MVRLKRSRGAVADKKPKPAEPKPEAKTPEAALEEVAAGAEAEDADGDDEDDAVLGPDDDTESDDELGEIVVGVGKEKTEE
jgi:hypothetical protein